MSRTRRAYNKKTWISSSYFCGWKRHLSRHPFAQHNSKDATTDMYSGEREEALSQYQKIKDMKKELVRITKVLIS